MPETKLHDHPLRYELNNELHARPFPELVAPCTAVFLAIKNPEKAVERDRELDRKHLLSLLDRFGASHPAPGAGHYSGKVGRGFLKWEMHTEFVTYTYYVDTVSDVPFSASAFSIFPADWLTESPGSVLTSALIRVEQCNEDTDFENLLANKIPNWFASESLAIAKVVDNEAVIAADFRIDESGHIRFAVLSKPEISKRRLGRIVQRLLEIETYKTASMLTLPIARKISRRVSELDQELAEIVQQMSQNDGEEGKTLDRLLRLSAEIEHLSSSSAFRFGAAEAYETIVNRRISVLREERIKGRQLFSEFMMRRYDPAMRTCRSAQARLADLSARAERAANLLRTRVDVAVSEQNHEVLKQMDRRAELQLRLQETVEGLSVVAISYYAVSLAGYLFTPFSERIGLSNYTLMAAITVPVMILVFASVRRIKAKVGKHD